MCAILAACGGDTPGSNEQNDPQSENGDNARYAQEFADILLSANWDNRDWDSVLYFNEDGSYKMYFNGKFWDPVS